MMCTPVLKENPITTEIIRNAFISIAREMNESLFRSAYSPIIYEMKDCAVAIFDANLNPLGQSQGVPLFLGNLEETIKAAIDYYGGKEYFKPGDVYIMNDSYLTGTHLNDVTIFAPCYYEALLVGFTATRAHWFDIGAKDAAYSIDSTSIFQEGLRLGPLKIINQGSPNQDLIDTICMNSRFPINAHGDMNAQIAACHTGEGRLKALIERFGYETLMNSAHDIFIQSQLLEEEVVSQIKEGEYYAEGFLDNDGATNNRVFVRVKITVKSGKITVDLSDSSTMAVGSTNCGKAQAIAAVRVAYKMITLPHAPVTGGSFKPLEVIVKPRTIFAAEEPAACTWYFSHLGLTIDLIIKALSDALPNNVAAAHYGDSMVMYLSGFNPKDGKLYAISEPTLGGWGGTWCQDGGDCLINVCNGDFKNLPVEVFESLYPMKINKLEIRRNSGGPGKFRGGNGLIKMFSSLAEEAHLRTWFERTQCPAWGVHGGKDGLPPEVTVNHGGKQIAVGLEKVNDFLIKKGWEVVIKTGGGGGYGNPLLRSPELVAKDVNQDYVSKEFAKTEYGVVLTYNGEVDQHATQIERKKRLGFDKV
ncbi:MAG: hydantoinase B/oxoprolinase family protein [Saccharofermentanales bacterium]|jgi:N-methylhydantoinase B